MGIGWLSHIDLASVGRLELLRGPFSVLYCNSSGGVTQVFTQEGEGSPLLSSSLATGSYGLRRIDAKASGCAGSFSYVVSAGQLNTQGFREHSATELKAGNALLDGTLSDESRLTLVANALSLDAQDPLGLNRTQFDSTPRTANLLAK